MINQDSGTDTGIEPREPARDLVNSVIPYGVLTKERTQLAFRVLGIADNVGDVLTSLIEAIPTEERRILCRRDVLRAWCDGYNVFYIRSMIARATS